MGQPLMPDLPNWAWHEYGMRVGFWRIRDALTQRGIVPTMATNGIVCDSYPRIVEAALKENWEMMGHGFVQGPMHKLPNQAESIMATVDTIKRMSGKPPVGWESPGLTEDDNTLDCLSQAGIEYVADWVNDDQPYPMTLEDGRTIMSVPYSTELNDKPAYEKKNRTAEEFETMIRRQFDVLWREGETQARVIGLALHPYLTGFPHRIGALDGALEYMCKHEGVWLATGSEIAAAGRGAVGPA
jgi:peptidoglycan/xylan/chitin deacetylase (PgdA/CDA1 family)